MSSVYVDVTCLCAGKHPPFVSCIYAQNKSCYSFLSRGAAVISVPRSLSEESPAQVVQRVGHVYHGGDFSGDDGSTRTPGSHPPSVVSVFHAKPLARLVICIHTVNPFRPTTPAAPAFPSDADVPLHVPRDVSSVTPADGSTLADTVPAGAVGGDGIVPTTPTPGGGGDSQEPEQLPTSVGAEPDLRPHLLPVVGGNRNGSQLQAVCWVVSKVCGVLVGAILLIALCGWCFSPKEGNEDSGESEGNQPASHSTNRETTKNKKNIRKGCTNV